MDSNIFPIILMVFGGVIIVSLIRGGKDRPKKKRVQPDRPTPNGTPPGGPGLVAPTLNKAQAKATLTKAVTKPKPKVKSSEGKGQLGQTILKHLIKGR